MFSTGYMAAFKAVDFYKELENSSVSRFAIVCASAFGSSFCIVLAVMLGGFLTFGGASQGFILKNYAVEDVGASVGRVCCWLSIFTTFPLLCSTCRDDLLHLLVGRTEQWKTDVTTCLLVLSIVVLGMFVTDLGFVIAMSGAVLGNLIAYVFPALIYVGHYRRGGEVSSLRGRVEYVVNICIVSAGIFLSITGVLVTVCMQYFPQFM